MKHLMLAFACALLATVFLVSCAPNRAITRNEGTSSHAKAEQPAQIDDKYAENDDYDLETKEVVPAVSSTRAKSKKPVKNVERNEDIEEYDDTPVAAAPKVSAASKVPSSGYYQTGIASWYGREFHGKKTASGEKFDMNEMTAAHRTLPLGSVVYVKNLDNGKSVQVRINDRGPYKGKRILDLSYAAAKKIDMVGDGQAMVGIKMVGAGSRDYSQADDDTFDEPASGIVSEREPSIPAKQKNRVAKEENAETGSVALQTGAFYSKKNAEKLQSRLEEILPGKNIVVTRDNDLYKVKVTGITSRKDAERYKKALKKENLEAFVESQE